MTLRQKEIIFNIMLLFAVTPVVIIFFCVILLTLSESIEAVTGFDLVRDCIRPLFTK